MNNKLAINSDMAIKRIGDEETYIEIVQYFIENLPTTINNLKQALKESNLSLDATRIAHSLKSNCATIGADILRDECATLEQLCKNNNSTEARLLAASIIELLKQLPDKFSHL